MLEVTGRSDSELTNVKDISVRALIAEQWAGGWLETRCSCEGRDAIEAELLNLLIQCTGKQRKRNPKCKHTRDTTQHKKWSRFKAKVTQKHSRNMVNR